MFDLKQVSDKLKIDQINQLIIKKFSSDSRRIQEICNYAFQQKGKQLRPILTLLIAQTAGIKSIPESVPDDLLTVSAGIELIHFATIIHDDIIDKSTLRRNQPSVYHEYGTNDGIITGDYLLVKAFGLCGQLDKRIVSATEFACTRLTEGEIMETPLDTEDHSIESYIDIAGKKTAALFRLAAESAAIIAGCNKQQIAHFADFAENTGIAFQILDDILDVKAEVSKFGKNVGTDIREKKPSIVNILWLESGDSAANVLKSPAEIKNEQIPELIASIKSGNSLQRAQEYAEKYINNAKNSLLEATKGLDYDSDSFQIINSLLDYVISRSK